MKRPTVASQKKVTPENLSRLGAPRLAEILAGVASTRPDLKRRLRMELAAEQGAEHLLPEIDRRLASLETSRSKVSWRQRSSFVRELEELRRLIAGRLAGLDRAAALPRLLGLLAAARRVQGRVRDRDGELAAVFARAAADLSPLLSETETAAAAAVLAEAIVHDPAPWTEWLPLALQEAPAQLAQATLVRLSARAGATAAWLPVLRRLADLAGDVDAFSATFTRAALKTPSIAAELAERLLAADRIAEAGAVLERARPGGATDLEEAWAAAQIQYLERSGDAQAAQAARWAAFERTLSVEWARAFTSRLPDFEDVEAEDRAIAQAAAHRDANRGLAFLMGWPALSAAAQMIERRANELNIGPEDAEAWAAKLRARYPAAAHLLLRKAAAAAFRRRDFRTCDRLTAEAESLGL